MPLKARVLVAAIVTYLDGTSNISAYLSEAPSPTQGRIVVVHPDAGHTSGPLGEPDRDLRLEFQTTCIGTTPEQAMWTHDQIAARLLRAVLSVDGELATHPIYEVLGSEQPIRRDDQLAQPVFIVTCSWVAHARPI